MSIKIGSNLASLNAQRRLGDSTTSLSRIYEKLSSGQRINRASDDAAGLAIADDLKAKGRIYTQAIRNGNDGISLLNIADSAIDAVTGIVTRIRELSEQSANGTYSNEQRQALDAEAQALSSEFTRITQTTAFNGLNIFDGSLGQGLRLQLGVGVSETLKASIGGLISTGTFGSNSTYETQTSGESSKSNAVTLGDLNGDGILDLVSAGYAVVGGRPQGQTSVQLGNADGTFGTETTYNTQTSAIDYAQTYSVTLGDVNGDSVLDLVSAGFAYDGDLFTNQGEASVLLGLGDGTFGSKTTYQTQISISGNAETYSVTLGDVNGDSVLDLVSAGYAQDTYFAYQGQVSVRLGLGNGSFGGITTYSTTDRKTLSVTLGDLNGDNILDLVSSGYGFGDEYFEGQTSVRLGNVDGTFASLSTYQTLTSANGDAISRSATLGDINRDGFLDLVSAGNARVGATYQGQASVLLGNSNGTFGGKTTYQTQTSASESDTRSVSLGDINGDGILDLVSAGTAVSGGSAKGQISVLLGRSNGTFGNQATYQTQTSGTGSASTESISLGDVNGDGILDLVGAGYRRVGLTYQGQASVLIATTQDGLAALQIFSLQTQADSLQAMEMLDDTLVNLAKQRGTIGASQSRINIAISNLQTSKENFAAAESRIRDADIAAEAANLVRTQILQQAAASVLYQANQAPQLALTLLR